MKGKIMQTDIWEIIWLILLLVFVYCCTGIYFGRETKYAMQRKGYNGWRYFWYGFFLRRSALYDAYTRLDLISLKNAQNKKSLIQKQKNCQQEINNGNDIAAEKRS